MEQLSGSRRETAWRTGFQRQYLSRLVDVLRRRRIKCATNVSSRSRAVKLAADLSLAMTAKGRTSWSRAILRKYIFRLKKTRRKPQVIKSHGETRSALDKTRPACKTIVSCIKSVRCSLGAASKLRSAHNCQEESGGSVASRMQTLRLLVPGSRGLDTPLFLKEAADYTVALKMQVQALQALADCYSNSSPPDSFQF